MANEYGELEQLVNDVTSLDTARMTLRWALERLQNIEKEKADLKKNLTLAEETAKRLQLKEASATDVYASRSKTLEEKEDFYGKLEATMSLLGEGKLDIQQLLKKEAKLDSLRKSLEDEYQGKFEELDRNQRAVIERWNGRLLEVEGQFAGRIAESQKKYDTLRAELEAEHQGRLTALQNSFKAREKDLTGRIELLEGSVRHSEEKVETRRRELEAEYLSKKRETEENYRKLRNLLEVGLEEKLRSADSDHSAQVTALETSWQAERGRLLEEQRVREDQFKAAQDRIKEIENGLAAQQDAHHSELLKMITDKETAFRAQLRALEDEKRATEETVRELQARLEKTAAAWDADRARMQADFDGRAARLEAALHEREAALESDHSSRKAALGTELEARLQQERRVLEAGKASLAADAAAYEADRRVHNEKINALAGELRAREEEFERQAARLEAEYAARREVFEKERAALLEGARADYEAKLAAERASWTAERERFESSLADTGTRFREAQEEIETLNSALRKAASENAARDAAATGEIVEAKAAFEKELAARVKEAVLAQTAALSEALEAARAAKADLGAALGVKDKEIAALKAEWSRSQSELEARFITDFSAAAETRRAELDAAYAARQSALERDLRHRREAMEQEVSLQAGRLNEENAALREALEKMGAAASSANARSAELAEKLLAADKKFHEEKLEMQKAQARELDLTLGAAVEAAVESAQQKLRLAREELAAVTKNRDELSERLYAEEKAFHAEKLAMQEAQVREFDETVTGAVNAAVELAEERLRHAHEELAKLKQERTDEVRVLEDQHDAEKARLMEEMDRRDRYIQGAEVKIQDLEHEMMRYRQTSSAELMKQVAEQDQRFRDAAAEEKARSEARLAQLEELLEAKEKQLADREKQFRQKQLELDGMNEDFSRRADKFNEELFAQKRALSEKEQALNDHRLNLEKDYSLKSQELEQMKAELTRAIMEYRKGR
ncbi:MAG: hypothetical protein A2X32_06130 [Elusimicrobia bacterium GWC2_64_44]|nr:MAG: hypothetical protein A2X32_06130 [Elusimicrobia bacterium GWC2_64_44]